ncbi:MAG: 16S rRNA (guanine(527)-N(7))-methyltransferase RsmG [Bacilli bacterium]|nr:16S rRNA (guanine(527)-N(7))-methyltransferase RsmG [Bacilli bacterium]
MNIDEFKDEISKIGIEYDNDKLLKLEKYYELLIDWNNKINLTAIVDKEQVYLKHFYDSLTLFKIVDLNKIDSLCDLGTGAGFPGIVIKIFFPNIKITLVDALNKRINFLNEVVQKLKLSNVTLIHSRAEDYGREHRECFDVVTARALSSLPVLLEYGVSLLKIDGMLCAMRGNDDSSDSLTAISQLNVSLEKIVHFQLPYEKSNRTLILFRKLSKTNIKYPRRFIEIKKKPL